MPGGLVVFLSSEFQAARFVDFRQKNGMQKNLAIDACASFFCIQFFCLSSTQWFETIDSCVPIRVIRSTNSQNLLRPRRMSNHEGHEGHEGKGISGKVRVPSPRGTRPVGAFGHKHPAALVVLPCHA
jgi:hypothetical protein